MDTATFSAGCFWCVEEAFDKVDGVISTTSGYTAGRIPNPTYEQVSSRGTGRAEAVQVTYDPSKVSYDTLLKTFWHNVDAVDAGGHFAIAGANIAQGSIFIPRNSGSRLKPRRRRLLPSSASLLPPRL